MKLIFAGIPGGLADSYSNFIFNCTRDPKCQRAYTVPLRTVGDLILYADFPLGKPESIEAVLIDTCDNTEVLVVFSKYVIGQKPDGSWYGVFHTPVGDFLNLKCFVVKLSFTGPLIIIEENNPDILTEDGQNILMESGESSSYILYSEQYCIEDCDPLTLLKSCYPDEVIGTDAEDCNGIYYGFHAGEDGEALGDISVRYYHQGYVRMGSVIEQKNKIALSLFNSRKVYKNIVSKESLLEFELVPKFYKDHLFGIFARGTITIDGGEYLLAEDQEFAILDNDSKLWKMDVALTELCKQYFGCKDSTCIPPIPPCVLTALGLTIELDESYSGTFVGSFLLGDGQSLFWEILNYDDGSSFDSGTISTMPLTFPIAGGFDPVTKCYLIRWRLQCADGQFSSWQSVTYGNCDPHCVTYNAFIDPKAIAPVTITYLDCNGVEQNIVIDPNSEQDFCALENSPSSSDPTKTIITKINDACVSEEPIECTMGQLNPFAGTLTVLKNADGAIGVSGTITCIICPCDLSAGQIVGRTNPSSPCNPCEDTESIDGNWIFGPSGYLVYIGPTVTVDCSGLLIGADFNDPCHIEPV